jgi:hypothetical protein
LNVGSLVDARYWIPLTGVTALKNTWAMPGCRLVAVPMLLAAMVLAIAGCGGADPQKAWDDRTGPDWSGFEAGLASGWDAGCTKAWDVIEAEIVAEVPRMAGQTWEIAPDCRFPKELKALEGPLSASEAIAETVFEVDVPTSIPADPETAGYDKGVWAGCLSAFNQVSPRFGVGPGEGADRCPLDSAP